MKALLLVNSEQGFVWEEKGGKTTQRYIHLFLQILLLCCGVIQGRGRLIGGWKFLFCFGVVACFFPQILKTVGS